MSGITVEAFVGLLAACALFGGIASRVARENGRSSVLWLFIGAALPVFGTALLLWLGKKNQVQNKGL